jgi:hypothetical protein
MDGGETLHIISRSVVFTITPIKMHGIVNRLRIRTSHYLFELSLSALDVN